MYSYELHVHTKYAVHEGNIPVLHGEVLKAIMKQITFERIQASTADQIKHRVWIISDLQQSDPGIARECISAAVNDFRSLDMPCEQIWYLGDSVEGKNEAVLRQMVEMQIDLLQALDIPLIFVTGNHEFDPYWHQVHNPPLRKQIR